MHRHHTSFRAWNANCFVTASMRIILALGVFFAAMARDQIYAFQPNPMGWSVPLSNEQAWNVIPSPKSGAGKELPEWVRIMANDLPKSAAAMLELDFVQRKMGAVDPKLRAAMRYVAAKAIGCSYSMAAATLDANEVGVRAELWKDLENGSLTHWSSNDQAALNFALKMTLDSDSFSDEEFQRLVENFGDRAVGCMVLHLAYANFMDRWLICLGVAKQTSAMPAVDVSFTPESLTTTTTPPSTQAHPMMPTSASNEIEKYDNPTWLPYPMLQERLVQQRKRSTRLPIPAWSDFADKLPKGLMEKPSEIVWYKIAFGYAHELAVPFEIYLRTAGSEIRSNWDRPFGNCLFWMVTDAMKCPYCMGHCEMNWEVMGYNPLQIAGVSKILSGSDWSAFTLEQQQALRFARKLTATPGDIKPEDLKELQKGFGQQRALFMALNISRYNYMTRISNGFQLTLEEGNPFWDYYRMSPPTPSPQK